MKLVTDEVYNKDEGTVTLSVSSYAKIKGVMLLLGAMLIFMAAFFSRSYDKAICRVERLEEEVDEIVCPPSDPPGNGPDEEKSATRKEQQSPAGKSQTSSDSPVTTYTPDPVKEA